MGIEVFPLPASGPSLAEITSAITTNAAPATVTMPAITSSITTNAASSGVTMAAITSAITTNAASSGVTLAAIGTQVANNSVSTENWVLIGSLQTTTAATYTFSSIPSGYKKLMLIAGNIRGVSGNVSVLSMRFNNDSSSLYSTAMMFGGGSNDYYDTYSFAHLTRQNWGNTNSIFQTIILNGSNPMKFAYTQGVLGAANAGATSFNFIMSTYKSSTEINRIDLFSSGDSINSGTSGGVALYGAK